MAVVERKADFKLRQWLELERDIQAKWEQLKIAESDYDPNDLRETFLTTFPYPYMNGVLHLGHSFSLSKCEFIVRYKKLKGFKAIFPFGFHCTGMPIKACADKLKREIETYGNPPVFPSEDEEDDNAENNTPNNVQDCNILKDKAKGKKSKAVAKTGTAKYQWQIMQLIGVPESEIASLLMPIIG